MRISDWSSDVCSSDLVNGRAYKADDLKATIKAKTSPIELLVQTGDVYRTVKLKYDGGLRYPRLKPTKQGKGRSEERRVGTECVSQRRSGWSQYHSTNKQYQQAAYT